MPKKNNLLNLARFSFAGFLLTFPLQIRIIFQSSDIFAFGKFSPYFTDFIFLNDLFLLTSLILWGIHQLLHPRKKIHYGQARFLIILLALIILSEISYLFIPHPNTFILLRIFEFIGLYLLILNSLLKFTTVLKLLTISLILPAIVSPIQFFLQQSIGLSFLGEPTLNSQLPGVAKIDLPSGKLLRSYGTLAHPNLLGGLLSFGILASSYVFQKTKKKRYLLFLLILLFGLIFTFSRSAFLALILSLLAYYLVQKRTSSLIFRQLNFKLLTIILGGLLILGIIFPISTQILQSRLPDFTQTEIQTRLIQYQNSIKIISQNPLGVGITQSIPYLQNVSSQKFAPWDYQPIHNLWLLITTELGIPGLLLSLTLLFIIYQQMKKQRRQFINPKTLRINHFNLSLLILLFILSLFDHYLLTLYQGQILLVLFFSFININSSTSAKILKK